MGKLSDYALNMIATDLSEFNAPDIPDLELPDDRTLQNSMLENVLGVFSGPDNAEVRHTMTDMVRRIFGSIEK